MSNTRQAWKKERAGALARQLLAQRQEALLIWKWVGKGMRAVCPERDAECIRLPSDAGRHKIPMHLQLEFTVCRLCANLSNIRQPEERMGRYFHRAALCAEMGTLCQNRLRSDFSQSYRSDARERGNKCIETFCAVDAGNRENTAYCTMNCTRNAALVQYRMHSRKA